MFHYIIINKKFKTIRKVDEKKFNSVFSYYRCDFLDYDSYIFFHSLIGILGDMSLLLRKIHDFSVKSNDPQIITILSNLSTQLETFREVRNFFAHIDERLSDTSREHGVYGNLSIPEINLTCLQNCECFFYFVFQGDTLYFHDKQKGEPKASPKMFTFNKKSFEPFFNDLIKLCDYYLKYETKPRITITGKDLFPIK